MKNLKKLLGLTLASAMTLTMVAGATSFTDYEDIKTTEAVDMLTTLGILNGFTDGTFRPEDTVTRAQMAKMIYVIKNGGVDDGAKYYENAVDAFNDTEGHWAEGYINYAYTLGIIAGNGQGSFRPDDEVTGVEAAKMMLTVLGYDAEVAGLVGASWSTKTVSIATEKDLFDDYELGLTDDAERQYAAQLVYNSLFSEMVKLVDGSYEDIYIDGSPELMGERYMGLATAEGVLVATGEYELGTVTDSDKDHVVIMLEDGTTEAFEYKEDLSHLIGKEVSIVADEDDSEVYGIYATQDNNSVKVAMGDIELDGTDKIELDGNSYGFEANALAFEGSGTAGLSFATAFSAPENTGRVVEFISNDGDDDFEVAIISNVEPAQITAVYSSRITTTASDFSSIDLEDEDVAVTSYDGIEKDDFVFITENLNTGDIVIEKMETVSGTVEALRSEEVRVNDMWFKLSSEALAGATLPGIDAEVTLHVNGDYVYAVSDDVSVSNDIAIVTASTTSTNIDGNYEAKLLFADNSEKVVEIDSAVAIGSLITYSIDGDIYEVEVVSSTNIAGNDNYEALADQGFNATTNKIGSYHIADDAQIFIKYVDDGKTEYKVIKGEELANMSASFGTSSMVLSVDENGFKYAKVALIETDSEIPSLSGEENVGYVLDTPYISARTADTKVNYSIFNGTEIIEVATDSSVVEAAKGDFIAFDLVGEGTIDNIEKIGQTDFAVTAYDKNTGELMVNGDDKVYKITEDTKVVYVDSESIEGFAEGQIRLADKADADTYINNVTFKAATTEIDGVYELEFLAVDINNEMN